MNCFDLSRKLLAANQKPMMKHAIVTLLTDFGTRDHYVASMKGVILNINPRCTLVDITHQVKPHDIAEAAFLLANAYGSFPRGTIHLCVVDPGVGSLRKPVLMVAGDHFFVGPDNGLFTLVAQREKAKSVVVLTNSRFFLPSVSTTFQGRDVFAPVAAHLSVGVSPRAFGPKTDDWVTLSLQEPRRRGRTLRGEIIHIDAFGNLITNITEGALTEFVKGHRFRIRAGRRTIREVKESYWQGKSSEPMGLVGSGGFLEISVREGNAQEALKARKGDEVKIELIR